jgi:hypothetical protein
VSRPIPYLSDDDFGTGITAEVERDKNLSTMRRNQNTDTPDVASSVISKICSSLSQFAFPNSELRKFLLALCHKCISRSLLLDGFYATTETEADEPPPSTSSTKLLTTGDTVRVSVNPSNSLQFDATKCSDSIAILSSAENITTSSGNGPSVNQRASKVWGIVFSTQYFSPKTGVHRWAVRLDKCERGHVFIGVATAQASI